MKVEQRVRFQNMSQPLLTGAQRSAKVVLWQQDLRKWKFQKFKKVKVSKHESASTNWSPTEGQGWALKTVSKYRALTTRLKKVKTRSGKEDNKNYNNWKVKTKDKKHDNRILSEWGLIQRTGVASFPISDYKWATPGWGIESGKVKWFVERTKCIWTRCLQANPSNVAKCEWLVGTYYRPRDYLCTRTDLPTSCLLVLLLNPKPRPHLILPSWPFCIEENIEI